MLWLIKIMLKNRIENMWLSAKFGLEVQKSLKKTQELFDSLMQKYFG